MNQRPTRRFGAGVTCDHDKNGVRDSFGLHRSGIRCVRSTPNAATALVGDIVLTAQVVFGVAVSGFVSLLAAASGASSTQAGGIIAALAFGAFYAGLWTPSISGWLSRASRFALFKNYIGGSRLSVTDTGIWVSGDAGGRSFMPYSSIGSARVSNTLLVLSPKKDRLFALFAVPVRLLTPERQARIIELVRAHAPQVS